MQRRLVLCRHTETSHNANRIYTGQMDIPINSTGASQAIRLSREIAELEGLCGIISSDLKRTMHLANAIARRTGLQVHRMRKLREAHVGEMQGLRKGEIVHRYPNPALRTSNKDFDFRGIGGEHAKGVIDRQVDAICSAEHLFNQASGPIARLVVVGHGTALRLLFRDRLGLIRELHDQGDYQEVDCPDHRNNLIICRSWSRSALTRLVRHRERALALPDV